MFANSGVLVVYTLRVNMSVACVDMADDLNWTEAEKGLVLVCLTFVFWVGLILLSLSLPSTGVMQLVRFPVPGWLKSTEPSGSLASVWPFPRF